MRNSRGGGQIQMMSETSYNPPPQRKKFGEMLQSDPNHDEDQNSFRISSTSEASPSSYISNNRPPSFDYSYPAINRASWESSPFNSAASPALPTDIQSSLSPLSKSPWSSHVLNQDQTEDNHNYSYTGLMGSLVREEGHIYSLAAYGDLLYTGSDSKNIRVWKNQKEFSGFKSNSGLVKTIIIAGEKIFTAHQDGKIRVWKVSSKNPNIHKRIGTLPTFKSYIKTSINPGNYIEARRNRNVVWIKHFDAISCLSLSEDKKLLYSASWDKTIKVWRASDSKCLESIKAHDDAVNSVVYGFDGLVFSGSADGSVKAWRRELQGKGTKHFFSQTLLKQECAVTSLAVDPSAIILYCGSSDGLVNFWEREKLLSHGGVLRGHKLAVLCLATAGNLLFSGSADTNICVWKREAEGNHLCLSVLSGHSGPVKCLAVEEDGCGAAAAAGGDRHWIVYSGSLDKSVKIWRVSAQPEHIRQQPQCKTETFPSLQSFSSQGCRISQRRNC